MKNSSADHRRRSLHYKRWARRIALIGLSIWFSQSLRAEISPALMEATKPLLEGVPEVAVVRLLALLDSTLTDEEWCAVAAKLAEARVAARQPWDALLLLADLTTARMTAFKPGKVLARASLCQFASMGRRTAALRGTGGGPKFIISRSSHFWSRRRVAWVGKTG